MTVTTINFPTHTARTTPRGAIWAATAFAALLRAGNKVMDRLTEQRRRAAELHAAHEMMLMAREYDDTQPGFAADLRSAAMRMYRD